MMPILNRDEVSDFDYVDINDVLEQVKISPQNYTVWFKKLLNELQIISINTKFISMKQLVPNFLIMTALFTSCVSIQRCNGSFFV